MGIMSMLVEALNEEEKKNGGTGTEWTDLHTTPVELIQTPHGIVKKDIKTGRFISEVER